MKWACLGIIFGLVEKRFSVPIDWEVAYKEVREYLEDENAWMAAGIHFLVLKKDSERIVKNIPKMIQESVFSALAS